MEFIQFDPTISKIESYDTIGYDVETETLKVKFFDESERTFFHVPQKTIFHWLLAKDKESYYKQFILPLHEKEGCTTI